MRIEFIKRNPDEPDIRVPDYDQMDLPEKSVLYRAMKQALRDAAKVETETKYNG